MTTLHYKPKVMRHLEKLGGTIDGPNHEPVYDCWEANVDAPHGYVWTHTGTHCVCIGNAPDRRTLWKWVWVDVGEESVIECDQRPNCDVCDYDEDDE